MLNLVIVVTAGADQVCDKLIVHIQVALILSLIAEVVAFIQDAPHLRPQPKRMGKHLKNNIPMLRPVAMPT